MEAHNSSLSSSKEREDQVELRKGPWTEEEDLVLTNYIENRGKGQWNSLARCSGLKRTGKSCRLRWLNYLQPDVKRGNITLEEQLLILELHSQYGNRWSKIAQHLPGRTDNEIKNYWRTRVQKHAKQLQCDVNSTKFKDIMRCLWMPRLIERIRVASGSCPAPPDDVINLPACPNGQLGQASLSSETSNNSNSNSNSAVTSLVSSPPGENNGETQYESGWSGFEQSPGGNFNLGLVDIEQWDMGGNLWNVEDIWF